jgi:hypothetical protein
MARLELRQLRIQIGLVLRLLCRVARDNLNLAGLWIDQHTRYRKPSRHCCLHGADYVTLPKG